MFYVVLLCTFIFLLHFPSTTTITNELLGNSIRSLHLGSQQLRYENACDNICSDLPLDDRMPVCMMFSRYKKGYQFFANMCHARRAICKDNLVLHVVHQERCLRTKQFFMSMN